MADAKGPAEVAGAGSGVVVGRGGGGTGIVLGG